MNQGLFSMVFNVPGTLGANYEFPFHVPYDATLIHVSAGNTSANQGTVEVGTAADPNAFLVAMNFGISNASSQAKNYTDFAGVLAGSQWPRLVRDTDYLVTITDNSMGNTCVVLTFNVG